MYKYIRARIDELRDSIFSYLGRKCSRCGFADKRALEIHHLKGKGGEHRKSFRNNYIKYLEDVLQKVKEGSRDYVVLCANCHRIIEASKNEKEVITQAYFVVPENQQEQIKWINLKRVDEERRMFFAYVQVGSRIQISSPVKSLLDIKENDFVEVTLRKLQKEGKTGEPRTFVACVQIGDRIQIPDPIEEIDDIKKGDILEVALRKLETFQKKG
jgi:bifunctional DNA-binding transcriptional regulator/antitoxin component of YhaV-PrlF toxin-antitoxin module